MALALEPFAEIGLDQGLMQHLLESHERDAVPRLNRFWKYYRNPSSSWSGREDAPSTASRLAQAQGLPTRLRGNASPRDDDRARSAKEIVIENDIAWRVHAMVDFMTAGPMRFISLARSKDARNGVERVLDAVFEAAGGAGFIQDMLLLGAVYGHVDVLLRADKLFQIEPAPFSDNQNPDRATDVVDRISLELIEPTRSIPFLQTNDYRNISALIVRSKTQANSVTDASAGTLGAVRRRLLGGRTTERDALDVVEIHAAHRRQRYENLRLVDDAVNPLGITPITHIQNISQPFRYEGLSEVEALIPLQNELNTRLSDRAHRVTMQAFKMYLVKGVDGVGESGPAAVGPGKLWVTDNPDASVEAFGGDGAAPSESMHIDEIRLAMDKASAVSPVAVGLIQGNVGNLSSAAALRITMQGLFAKAARKQVTYGAGLVRIAKLVLHALDAAGIYRTDPKDREIDVQWPNPLLEAEQDKLEAAAQKRELGVSRERVLTELGYATNDPGIV